MSKSEAKAHACNRPATHARGPSPLRDVLQYMIPGGIPSELTGMGIGWCNTVTQVLTKMIPIFTDGIGIRML